MEEKGPEGGETDDPSPGFNENTADFFQTLILRKEISLRFPACFGRENDEMRE